MHETTFILNTTP